MLKIYDSKPAISVITLCCNRIEYTSRTVSSVVSAMGDVRYEYIVVNAASSDGTRQWLDYVRKLTFFKRVKPVHLESNKGIWDGYACGVRASSSDLILITDNDICVHSEQIGAKIISSGHRQGQADFVESQNLRTKACKQVDFPTAMFYMRKSDFKFGYQFPDDYRSSGLRFFVHRDIVCEHIDGARGDELGTGPNKGIWVRGLSKKKYPPRIIYSNLEGSCPTGKTSFRGAGGESEFWKRKA